MAGEGAENRAEMQQLLRWTPEAVEFYVSIQDHRSPCQNRSSLRLDHFFSQCYRQSALESSEQQRRANPAAGDQPVTKNARVIETLPSKHTITPEPEVAQCLFEIDQ